MATRAHRARRVSPPRLRKATKPSARRTAARLAGARTIVYVHGIGNKPPQSILKCQWDQALFGFDLGERSRLAYWVNRDYYPDPASGTCASGDLIGLEDDPTGKAITIAQHLQQVSLDDEVRAVSDDPRRQQVLRAIAQKVEGAEATVTAPMARRLRGKILPLPAVLRRWITRRLTRALLRDVHDYLFVTARREQMRESMVERLRAGGGPFVVIGHSQGSLIAYDVLSSLDPDTFEVPLFVTIGSPLGIAEVQDQLKPLTGQRTLRVPPCVGRWLNVADPLDPVAADKGLANDFEPEGAIDDNLEWNPDSPRHPHSGSGYLRTRPVRTAVHDLVETALFQPVADFVIARDLVREIENDEAPVRHPVLIELVDPSRALNTPVDQIRDEVVSHIRRIARADEATLRVERLRRFVAADLTREEAEMLASHLAASRAPVPSTGLVWRIWRNARKHALLDRSAHTVQALAAHTSHQALGRGITWAVLDSGIAAGHPHFARHTNVEAEFDCTSRGPLSTGGRAADRNGHGTHVAGIIAGQHATDEADGSTRAFSGIAPETRLRVYKVLNDEGEGEDAWIIKALDHIAETNERAGALVIHGVNLSLGGPFDQSVYGCGHTPLCEELRRLWRQGVVVVLAAGNEGFAVLQTLEGTIDANLDLSIGDPANLDEAIAVGSVHKENPHTYGVSYFSSRGPTADGRQKPDLVAPGERVLSCRHRWPNAAKTTDKLYVAMSGTSMAAPHVSGVIAAFLSMRREFLGYPDQVKRILLENCTDLKRDRPQQGAGLPNLLRMLMNT